MPVLDHPPGLLALITLVRDCSVSGVPRRVLLLRTDLLPQRLSRPHHLRLAHEALDPLDGAERSRRYALAHERAAVSWRGEAPDRLRQTLDGLEHLLVDAPLDSPALPELVRLFELPADGAALLALASAPSLIEQNMQQQATVPPPPPVSAPRPLDPAEIEGMEARLAAANVARFARRRTVCRIGPREFTTAWEMRFLNIDELMAELAPKRNAFADPWLFRRLTRTLDRRMLALLSAPAELRDAGPFSLALNVGGVLSPEFLRFDSTLPQQLRGHAVLDLQVADVMSDIPAYRFARAFARSRGYRVLLRGLSGALLPLLDLPALDVDFIELRWEPSLAGLDIAALRAGTARWVLSRTDEAAAIRWGQSAGIGLYQGDAVLSGAALPDPERPGARHTAGHAAARAAA